MKKKIQSLWSVVRHGVMVGREFLGTHKRAILLLAVSVGVALLMNLKPLLQSVNFGTLDGSFNYGFNQAAASGFSFGDQYIATYGPLGYLVSVYLPQFLGIASGWLLLYCCALGVGVFLLCRTYLAYKSFGLQFLVALAAIYAFSITFAGSSIEWNYLMVFILYCFLSMSWSVRVWRLAIAVLAFFAAIFIFIKFTLGIAAVGTLFLLPLFTSKSWRELVVRYAILSGVFGIVVLILCWLLNIGSLWAYAMSSLLMSSGFSDAMSYAGQHALLATVLAGAALGMVCLWLVIAVRWPGMLRYLFLLPTLFVIWKYSVVRQDSHILRLVQVVLPLVVVLWAALPVMRQKFLRGGMVVGVTVCAVGAIFANDPTAFRNEFLPALGGPLTNVATFQPIAFFNLKDQETRWVEESFKNTESARLPQSMREAIGDKSVDIYPWEASIVFANDLQWSSRPSPYSFETYDPMFDNANAAFYRSDKSPEFIVWHATSEVNSVDGRHILWDEPASLREVLQHYRLIQSNDNFILLQRIEQDALELPRQTIATTQRRLGEWIEVPSSNALLYASITLPKESAISELKQLIVRGEDYYITLMAESGKLMTYRFVPKNSQQGFLINEAPMSWHQLIGVLETRESGNRIMAIKINQGLGEAVQGASLTVRWFQE